MTDRLAIIDPPGDTADTTVVRGRGILEILGQFQWAVRTGRGVTIPVGKIPIATAALAAAGWSVDGGGGKNRSRIEEQAVSYGLEPPMCEACRGPYRRGKIPRPGERCWHCDAPLRLVEVFEARCPGGTLCTNEHPNGLRCQPGQGITVVAYRPYDALEVGGML